MRVSFFPRALLFPMYAYELFSFNLHQYTTSMLACSGHEVSRRQSVTPPNRRGFPHSFWWFHQMIADILARHMIIMGLCINSISRIPFFLFCLQGAINSDNCPIISKCAPHNLNNHWICWHYYWSTWPHSAVFPKFVVLVRQDNIYKCEWTSIQWQIAISTVLRPHTDH